MPSMREMSTDEAYAFLADGRRTGKLAVARRDGRPMVTPVWFLIDDDRSLVFMTATSSIKARAMRREPRVSLAVDDERPPYAYVRLDGTAEVIDDQEALADWAVRIAERYMGAEWAATRGLRNAVPEERIVRVTPTRIVAWDDVAG
jgi:PPOX class probable F420-dependent enzyme